MQSMDSSSRIDALDGLRGVAALCVVLGHTIAVAFPVIGWGPIPVGSLAAAQTAVWNSPLQIFCNGGPWVCVFFLLSGFVLTRAAERSRANLPTLGLRRYLRLTVPSFVACLFGLACLALFPTAGNDMRVATGHTFLAVTDGALDTNLLHFLRTTLLDLYRGRMVKFDPPLWTMQIEFFGSLGIYLLVRLIPARARIAVAVLSIPCCLYVAGQSVFYAAFPLGFLFERAWRAGQLRHMRWIWLLPLAVGVAFGGDWLLGPQTSLRERYGELTVANLIATISAIGLFLAVLLSARLQRLLTSRPGQFLGHNSFAIYLLHFPLLAGPFAAWWVVEATSGKIVGWSIASVFLATLFACATIFTRFVDQPLLAWLHRIVLFPRRT
ncbi:acyltransferase family protein [Roseiterribacter gracilis]|uniref:Acyltransferase n=1 Tax=Roseiterribacter gracilis TaxID=2812848 RepID=A0A8S8XI71_9PROT|nr:acyltransferase [Rhodospirillales bacterium TMPK1]